MARITFAGESLIAQKQGAKEVLHITRFIYANVPGLDPQAPIDRAAPKPPASQIVYTYNIPAGNSGYVNPNQVVYSSMLGSDIGDFDWNWLGIESTEGVLFAVAYLPLQQKRRNIPPHQIGNNVTRNILVEYSGAQELTGITIDASTWQHDFTVRLKGIDERERLGNLDVFGRACFFSSSLKLEKVAGVYQVMPGTAYVAGIRVDRATAFLVVPPKFPTTAWLDVALQRELNDVVATWSVVFGADKVDYTDSTGTRHYCVAIADLPTANSVIDRRDIEPITGPLVAHFAARTGDYEHLRARATTKDDVELGNLPNAKSDDPATNSSNILATTAALNKLQKQIADPMTGMVSAFAMNTAPSGWLACNGAAISRTAFASLFARLGTLYGGGDGSTTFNLPDMRGLFPRGFDDGRGIDPGRVFGTFQDMLMQSHSHAASAAAGGDHIHGAWTDAQGEHGHTAWTDAQGNHDHGFRLTETGQGVVLGHRSGGVSRVDMELTEGQDANNRPLRTDYQGNHQHNVGIGAAGLHGHNVGIGWAGNHSHDVTVAASGGTETRPKNIALLFCIKY